jgi:murein DD-endopeptidase MepM/ murein hydrolase activator NlpD
MAARQFSIAELVSLARSAGGSRIFPVGFLVAALSVGLADASVRTGLHLAAPAPRPAVQAIAPLPARPAGPAWAGLDLDGDGAPDFANPTGHAPRGHDAFGDGWFHARRDGGAREHEGVDYDARAGQAVMAPISGFVSKIGYAYPGDTALKYVEIENPALNLQARVFYVDPEVQIGQPVALGTPIGQAHTLQRRYPGITDHVHLEVAEAGRKIDAQTVILARGPDGDRPAG